MRYLGYGYTCVVHKKQEKKKKKKKKGNIWMRKKGNIATIFLQYFHNKS